MASAKQIEAWVREVRPSAKNVRVSFAKTVTIVVDDTTYQLPKVGLDFAQIANALLRLGPSCAEHRHEHAH